MTNIISFESSACREVRGYFGHYLCNELLVETSIKVLSHLEGCESCARLFEECVKARSRLRVVVDQAEKAARLESKIRKSLRTREHPCVFRALVSGLARITRG